MMELKLSKEPLLKNPSCAYCGKVFNEKGVSLQLEVDHKVIHFPICEPCFKMVSSFEATVNLEDGFARINR
ncbi:MAG: hypothetical protein ABH969_10300 [Pseudomonadota bacterium]|jgi:hypothetical protein|nr:hypothetical protein [Deltaproteobacteria bacterium]